MPKNKKKQQPAPKTVPRKKRAPRARRDDAALSGCAADYARALANPFTGPLACVPDFPAMLTRRYRSYSKGNFTCSSATQFGFILFEPSYLATNDLLAVVASTSAYAGTTTTAGGAGVAAFTGNAEYPSTAFGDLPSQIQKRVVSAGIRVRYVGTNLNRGGQLCGLHEPDHNPLVGQSFADFDAQTQSARLPVGKEWSTLLFNPSSRRDLEMSGTFFNLPTDPVFYMGFVVQSPTSTDPANYEFEAFAVIEVEGRNVRGKAPSHVDPTGFSAVHAVATTDVLMRPTQAPDGHRELSMLQAAGHYLGTMVSKAGALAHGAVQLAETAGHVMQAGRAVARGYQATRGAAQAARYALPLVETMGMLTL